VPTPALEEEMTDTSMSDKDLPLPKEVWVVCANPSQHGKMSSTFVCDHRHEAMEHVNEVLEHHYAHNYRPWRVARYELAEANEAKAKRKPSGAATPRTNALVCFGGYDNLAVNTRAIIALCRELELELMELKASADSGLEDY
jgi:hypothetical protein